MPHSLSRLLIKPRECSSDWLIIQAKELADLGRRYSSHNLLVYASVEARNAIEQVWFEILLLVHGGEMSAEFFQECRRSRNGFLSAIHRAEPKYRKIFLFSKAALEADSNAPFNGIIWDLKKLTRLQSAISDYCHAQGHVAPTLASQAWVAHGYALIDETYEYFREQMSGAVTALLRPEAMTPSTFSIWERFDRGELHEAALAAELQNTIPSRT